MRVLGAILPLVLTVVLVYLLSIPIGSNPAIGKLLDPAGGFWANARCVDKGYDLELNSTLIKDEVSVWFDERLVPHIEANSDFDLYYAQGYVHAYFRLWQMDLQTRAAAGRISEILGPKAIEYDRGQRRKGMVYGAEQSLAAMEANPLSKTALDGYTAGVNSFISSLSARNYPLEYKLMGFAPEEWDNMRSALLLMYMADDLSGDVHDIGLTYYLQNVLTKEEMDFFFPEKVSGSTPVMPAGTVFDPVSLSRPDVPEGELFPKINFIQQPEDKQENGKGSNNWAVSGARTASGKPILCNDPHLSLNLPALWYEVQLTAPGINVYGVSLPGAPGVVIGFNDSIAWGFTNNYRDVKDFYTIDVIDKNTYRYNSTATQFNKRAEVIKVKGGKDVIDTVRYTVHGPLIYDEDFKEPNGIEQPLALRWMALEKSNELLSVSLLNRAKNYSEFVTAINYFLCPAQNFIYADTKGNIALWGQGQYVNKWKEQGKYIMSGKDSTTMWGDLVPVSENPHVVNPEQGFLSSANQNVSDTTYGYWYNGKFTELRAWRINDMLDTIDQVRVEDMFRMQNDEYSVLAAKVTPFLLGVLDTYNVHDGYTVLLENWNYRYSADSKAASIFHLWWAKLYATLWANTYDVSPDGLMPLHERVAQILLEDKGRFKNTDKVIVASYKVATDTLKHLEENGGIEWYKLKNTSINHLAKLKPFSYAGIHNGGWGNTVNAMKGNHGPSWRMVVQMNDKPVGYGIYPGGQSGDASSKYYGTFIDKWSAGEYNKLSFISKGEQADEQMVKYKWTIQKSKE